MHRYQILLEYVGTGFYGWQYQKKNITVQGTIQKILTKISYLVYIEHTMIVSINRIYFYL